MEQNPFNIEKEPFRVPENYWEEMEQQILHSTGLVHENLQARSKRMQFLIAHLKNVRSMAAVISIAIVCASLLYVFLPKQSETPDSSDYLTYAVVHLEEFDWQLLKEIYISNESDDLEFQMEDDLLEQWLEAEQWPLDWTDQIMIQ
jgi:hypothetical protein